MMIEDSLEYDDNHYMNQSPGLTIMIHCDSMTSGWETLVKGSIMHIIISPILTCDNKKSLFPNGRD